MLILLPCFSGGIPSPFDCYLASRGAKTLPLRALKHGLNALEIASALSHDSRIAKVSYPGLKSSQYYERAVGSLSRQAKKDLAKLGWDLRALDAKAGLINGILKPEQSHSTAGTALAGELHAQGIPFSGMISIRLQSSDSSDTEANHAITDKFLTSLRLFSLAESLGGVESLAEAPWKMTHGSIPEAQRIELGIDPSLVRLSVGIEDVDDLLADIRQALDLAYAKA
jgi:cystathionine gamma-lyase